MKFNIITGAALIATLGVVTPITVSSQPSNSGSYEAGYWQPTATINNNQVINVILQNESGVPVTYDSIYGPRFGTRLSHANTVLLNFPPIKNAEEIANINIYNGGGALLSFDYRTEDNNTVIVRIRRSDLIQGQVDNAAVGTSSVSAKYDSAVYIDERGRVYSF